MCNTGLEYIDLMKLTAEDITEINGKKYIVKSRMRLKVKCKLSRYSLKRTWNIDRYSSGTGFIFPPPKQPAVKQLSDWACRYLRDKQAFKHHCCPAYICNAYAYQRDAAWIREPYHGPQQHENNRIYAKMIVSKIDKRSA